MNAPIFVLLSVAGGVGAAVRLLVDGLVRARTRMSYPLGTTVINVSGSFLLGLITGLAAGRLVSPWLPLVLGTGLLGGYTTFSSASFETVRLVQERRYRAALINGLGMLVGAMLASAAGLWIGSVA